MKVVADTNVYVSAVIFGGKPQAILDHAQDGQIELFISDDIVAEVTRILRDKFKRTPEQLQNDLLSIEAITTRVRPTDRIDAVPNDPADNRILECAVASDADRVGLIRFRGHLPKGGYDVPHVRSEAGPPPAPAVH